jgi:hypothetical protein
MRGRGAMDVAVTILALNSRRGQRPLWLLLGERREAGRVSVESSQPGRETALFSLGHC